MPIRSVGPDTEVRIKVGGQVFASTAGVLKHVPALAHYYPEVVKSEHNASSTIQIENAMEDSDGVITMSWPTADAQAVPYVLRHLKMFWKEMQEPIDIANTFPKDRELLQLLKSEGQSQEIVGLPEGVDCILEEMDGKRSPSSAQGPSMLERVGAMTLIGAAAAFAVKSFLK